ncbi:hypothetical protein IFM89_009525 [Coptis chinensis]|uniref:Polygalacturonase n=1 Tax=Coptis chinensis TaxID=261450 RepID=A0A835HU53_9MAGN|nr:hypothetical protein IFM89_009525 [Coptis chinensis]
MSSFSLKSFAFILLIAFLVWSSTFELCIARRGKHWRKSKTVSDSLSKKKVKSHGSNHHQNNRGNSNPKSPPPSYTGPKKKNPTPPAKGDNGRNSAIFNVLKFGAKGDGNVDDTKAFETAWAAACKVKASAVLVPSDYVFLVGPVSFSGPYCQPDIVFQLDGTIIAPTDFKVWGSGLFQWLLFTKLIGITVQGRGTIDGRGTIWWKDSPLDDPIDDETKMLVPITNTTIDDSSHTPMNSKLSGKMPSMKPTALRFYGSFNVTVTGIKIINSPQCHLKFDNCIGVDVFDMSVSSPGDSLNTDGIHLQNSRDVVIRGTNIACGDDCVSIQTGCSNVYIHNVNCGPGHGISIGGLGKDNTKACVSNITVRDILMHNTMNGVRIKTWQEKYHLYDPFCWKTFGELRTPTVPPIDCLKVEKPAKNQIQSDRDSCLA